MIAGLFTEEMGARLADLSDAVEGGRVTTFAFEPEFGHLPDRVVVSIPDTGRRFVFGREMANSVADQLAANGHGETADRLRAMFG